MMKFALLLLKLLLLTYLVSGQPHRAIDVGHKTTVPVPDTVVCALHQLTPFSIDSLTWNCGEMDDSTYFRADFYQHRLSCFAAFDPLGNALGYLVEVNLNSLSPAARKSVYKLLLRNKKLWIQSPLGVIRAQLDSNNGVKRWHISAFASDEDKYLELPAFFYVWEEGEITYPQFR